MAGSPDPQAARRKAWTESVTAIHQVDRTRRGESLEKRARLDAALELYKKTFKLHHNVSIRAGFVRLEAEREVDQDPKPERAPFRARTHEGVLRDAIQSDVAGRPPLTMLSRRGEWPLRLYLSALYIAAGQSKEGQRFKTEIDNSYGSESWANLVALDGSPDNRRRRIVRAVQRLTDLQLAHPRGGRSVRWDRWQLLDETRSTRPYLVPRVIEPVLLVPPEFYRNGWHLVLRPREIVTYLMFVDLSSRFASAHSSKGVGASDKTRRAYYGVTPEVYEAHNELQELGLLELQPDTSAAARRAGRVPADVATAHHEGRVQMDTLRFKVVWAGLRRDAAKTVRTAMINHPVPRRFGEFLVPRSPSGAGNSVGAGSAEG